jgi:hypothetical protein
MAISSASVSVGYQPGQGRLDLSGIQEGINTRRQDTMDAVQQALDEWGMPGLAAAAMEGNPQAQRYFRQRGINPSDYTQQVWEWTETNENGEQVLRSVTNQAEAPEGAYQSWGSKVGWNPNQESAFRIARARFGAQQTADVPTERTVTEEGTATGTQDVWVPVDKPTREGGPKVRPPQPPPDEVTPPDDVNPPPPPGPGPAPPEDTPPPAATLDPVDVSDIRFVAHGGGHASPGSIVDASDPQAYAQKMDEFMSMYYRFRRTGDPTDFMKYQNGVGEGIAIPYTDPATGITVNRHLSVANPEDRRILDTLLNNWMIDQQTRTGDAEDLRRRAAGQQNAEGQAAREAEVDRARAMGERAAPNPNARTPGAVQGAEYRDEFGNPLTPAKPGTDNIYGTRQDEVGAAPKDFRVGRDIRTEIDSMTGEMVSQGPTLEEATAEYSEAVRAYSRLRTLDDTDPDKIAARERLNTARSTLQDVAGEGTTTSTGTMEGGEFVQFTSDTRPAAQSALQVIETSDITFDPGSVIDVQEAAVRSEQDGIATVDTRDAQTGRPVKALALNGNVRIAKNPEEVRAAELITASVTDPNSGVGRHGQLYVRQQVSKSMPVVRTRIEQIPEEEQARMRQAVTEVRSNDPYLNNVSQMIQTNPAQAAMYYGEAATAYLEARSTEASIAQAQAAARYSNAMATQTERSNQVMDDPRMIEIQRQMMEQELEALRIANERTRGIWENLENPALEAQLNMIFNESDQSDITTKYAREVALMDLRLAAFSMWYQEESLKQSAAGLNGAEGFTMDNLIDLLKLPQLQEGEGGKIGADLMTMLAGMTGTGGTYTFVPSKLWNSLPIIRSTRLGPGLKHDPNGGAPMGTPQQDTTGDKGVADTFAVPD